MSYGFGVFSLALGLILALAVQDSLGGVDLRMVGWIVAAVGVIAIGLTAATLSTRGTGTRRATTVHPDGSRTVRETRTDV